MRFKVELSDGSWFTYPTSMFRNARADWPRAQLVEFFQTKFRAAWQRSYFDSRRVVWVEVVYGPEA
jgi:hypothetical protein